MDILAINILILSIIIIAALLSYIIMLKARIAKIEAEPRWLKIEESPKARQDRYYRELPKRIEEYIEKAKDLDSPSERERILKYAEKLRLDHLAWMMDEDVRNKLGLTNDKMRSGWLG